MAAPCRRCRPEAAARLDRARRARAIRTSRGSSRPTTGAPSPIGQLREATGRIATFLRERGIGRNDRVALLANNSIEHLLCYFGVMAYGATICTVHVEMNRNQLDNIFDAAQAEAGAVSGRACSSTICSPPLRRRACRSDAGTSPAGGTFFEAVARCEPSDARTDAGPDDDAVILFTSGTSAQPKGVVLNFREHLGNIDPTADGFGIDARRPGVRFPLVQLGFGAAARRAGAGQPRRDAGDGGEILGAAASSSTSATTASRSRPAIRPPSTSCSTPTAARIATTCRRCASSPRARRR